MSTNLKNKAQQLTELVRDIQSEYLKIMAIEKGYKILVSTVFSASDGAPTMYSVRLLRKNVDQIYEGPSLLHILVQIGQFIESAEVAKSEPLGVKNLNAKLVNKSE